MDRVLRPAQPTVAVLCLLFFACAVAGAPTPPEKYEVLIGEGLAGSGFVVEYRGALWGVCSMHQFDGATPHEFAPLEGEPVKLDPSGVVKQEDVQALPVQKGGADIQSLPYDPDFDLADGDSVLVLAAGDVVKGRLTRRGMSGGTYTSSAGPATLSLRTDQPFTAAGGSGSPVLLKRTGGVIGVMLTADDPRHARTVGFETLCLGSKSSATAAANQPITTSALVSAVIVVLVAAVAIIVLPRMLGRRRGPPHLPQPPSASRS